MDGFLRVDVTTNDETSPIQGARVLIKSKDGTILFDLITDASGSTEVVSLDAPDVALTLDPNYHAPAYSVYDVEITAIGFKPVTVHSVQIVATQTSVLPVYMLPKYVGDGDGGDIYDIPPHEQALTGRQATSQEHSDAAGVLTQTQVAVMGPDAPTTDMGRIIQSRAGEVREVYIPTYITVHLGAPTNSSAQNVRVKFVDYVANVASSEIYSTWPYNSLVANIHAITSLAINRVYTEWYRGKGYNFDITNSTSYDQFFVYGRNIFENLRQIANSIYNVYTRRQFFRNPFYTEYCNGTTVTCPGMSQWGTVTLANQGLTPLQILRRYYPADLELVASNNIRDIQETYPGVTMQLGSNSRYVQLMQRYLNRIRRNYPAIIAINTPNGFFGPDTQTAVRTFQSTFALVADGVIGRTTWNLITRIYVAVTKLAELQSEGERYAIGATPPTVTLRQGSTGTNVSLLQFILSYISAYYPAVPPVIEDGVFGSGVTNSVREFQRYFGLGVDGVVGPATWRKLFDVFHGIENNAPPVVTPPVPPSTRPPFPGTLLRVGSRGDDVRTMQTYLNVIRTTYTKIPFLTADGIFGPLTENAVRIFQGQFNLVQDGVIGQLTWNKIVDVRIAIG